MSESKNLLIIAPIYSPYPGGGGNYFPKLANELKGYYSVTVLTERHIGISLLQTEDEVTVYRILPRRDSKYPLNIVSSAFRLLISFALIFIFTIYWSIKNSSSSSVIILTRYYFRPIFYFFYFYALIFKTRLVIDYRTAVDEKIAKRIFANYFSITFCNSESGQQQVDTHPNMKGRKHEFIPNGVELPDKIRKKPSELPLAYSLVVGTLSKRKSFDIVLPVQK